jgi:hypothetical protein
MGICLVMSSGTATVMYGALLSSVANPFALMSDFHIVYAGLCGFVSGFSESCFLQHSCQSLQSRLGPLWEFILLSFRSPYAAFLCQSGPKTALPECVLSF